MRHLFLSILIATLTLLIGAGGAVEAAGTGGEPEFVTVDVAGTGVHYFTIALVHSQEPTATGMVQRSTDLIALDGDLVGRVLYHPVSVFDFAAGTLTNTGHQVFSGSVLGAEPVLLHDNQFRFVVDLGTGATVGKVYFDNRLDGPRNIRCTLDVVGTGLTPEGDAQVAYTGTCRMLRNRLGRAHGQPIPSSSP